MTLTDLCRHCHKPHADGVRRGELGPFCSDVCAGFDQLARPMADLGTPDQWRRMDDTVYGLRAMLDDARSMRRRDVAILSDAFGFCRELLKRRPAEFGGPRECR